MPQSQGSLPWAAPDHNAGLPQGDERGRLQRLRSGQVSLREGLGGYFAGYHRDTLSGARLFQECREGGLLNTMDWDEYDMRRMVMKSELCEEDVKEITQKMYKLFMNPKYVMRKVANIRSYEDMAFIVRGAKKVVGHLKDFKA